MRFRGRKVNLVGLGIAAIIIFVCMATPNLRRIVWWLLPLGSGWDDIIGVGALAVAFIVFYTKFWTEIAPSDTIRKVNQQRYDEQE